MMEGYWDIVLALAVALISLVILFLGRFLSNTLKSQRLIFTIMGVEVELSVPKKRNDVIDDTIIKRAFTKAILKNEQKKGRQNLFNSVEGLNGITLIDFEDTKGEVAKINIRENYCVTRSGLSRFVQNVWYDGELENLTAKANGVMFEGKNFKTGEIKNTTIEFDYKLPLEKGQNLSLELNFKLAKSFIGDNSFWEIAKGIDFKDYLLELKFSQENKPKNARIIEITENYESKEYTNITNTKLVLTKASLKVYLKDLKGGSTYRLVWDW